ncbi:MAG: hypothetical protein JW709_04440 [Sedimentisphaerales bacterium]|nr:hypothetical protein [Sedimentisphaerales bacterium]
MNIWESSRGIILIAAAVEAVVFIAHLVRPDKVRWYAFLVGPVLAALGILADMAKETYRETVERVTREVVLAAEEEDAQAIIDRISVQFTHKNTLIKIAAEAIIRRRLKGPLIDYNKITRYDLTQDDPDHPVVEFTVFTQFDKNSPYGAIIEKTRWRFDFVRDEDGQYRIADIQLLKVGEQAGFDPFGNLPGGLL